MNFKSSFSCVLSIAIFTFANIASAAPLSEMSGNSGATSYQGPVVELVSLFNMEAETEGSPISTLLANLKTANEAVSIDSTIEGADIIAIKSAISPSQTETQYLIIIRGGSKYFESPVQYLKATSYENNITGNFVVSIDKPVTVKISE